MVRILKVTGKSLFPLIQEGDFVTVFKIPFFLWRIFPYRPGDIIVIKHPHYGTLIKKIEWCSPDGNQYYVVGNHPESTDSRTFGLVAREWLSGKVIWQIKKPARKTPV
jgi:nickel-type superoxide dismutase maturation protease